MSEKPEGCVKPSQGPILATKERPVLVPEYEKEVDMIQARVGKPAPDFELSAFIKGGFKNIKLSDYKGKWIVICFYPGDFTFV
jgi:peroxiredoxin (alkyl hydroperoxide reductase subunit C)